MPKLTNRFDEALRFASETHREQFRKGGNIPYVSHLMSVSALVLEHGGDEDQAIAALLHDAVEDQGGLDMLDDIRRRFGERVASIVLECSDSWETPKPKWEERKTAYIEALSTKSEDALLVSLADKVHNARSIRDDYRELGDEIWSRFTKGRDGTLWYHRELSSVFSRRMPGRLAETLENYLREFDS